MKLLTQLVAEARRITTEDPEKETDKEDYEEPLFTALSTMEGLYTELFEEFKDVNNELPDNIRNLLMAAFAYGASTALGILKEGFIVRNEDGEPIDTAYYSVEELLLEAESMICPNCTLSELTERLQEALNSDDELMEGLDEECDLDPDEPVTPAQLH